MISTTLLTSPKSATIDSIRDGSASIPVQVALIVAFAALTALGAQIRIYLWEVPFTLQTLAVYGSGLFLGWRNGLFAMTLYVLAGMFLPVFAGDGYGLSYLTGAASAGYIFPGFLLASLVAGAFSKRWNSLTGTALSTFLGSLVLFASGVTWLHFAAGHGSWMESIEKGWLRFIPVDLLKILSVSLVYWLARRAK